MAASRIAWDSSVLLAFLEQEDGRYGVVRQLLERAEGGEFDIAISMLVACEAGRIRRMANDEEQEAAIEAFLVQPYLVPVQIDYEVARIARAIVREHPSVPNESTGIKGADAVHIACAIRAKADVLHSYDGDHLRHDGAIHGLRIEEPTWRNGQPPLAGFAADGDPQRVEPPDLDAT